MVSYSSRPTGAHATERFFAAGWTILDGHLSWNGLDGEKIALELARYHEIIAEIEQAYWRQPEHVAWKQIQNIAWWSSLLKEKEEVTYYRDLLATHQITLTIAPSSGQLRITYNGKSIAIEGQTYRNPDTPAEEIIEEVFLDFSLVDPLQWNEGEDMLDAFVRFVSVNDYLDDSDGAKKEFRIKYRWVEQLKGLLGLELFTAFAQAERSYEGGEHVHK